EPEFGESPINLFVPAWNYNDRYLAQPIVQHIFLGPYHLVRRGEFLQQHAIQHILCIRDPSEVMFLREVQTNPPSQFHFIDVPADVTKLSIIPYFSQANQMIAGFVEAGQNLLVCCSDGIDKSASFVAGYLMSRYGLKAVDAVTFVQNHRYCATPSPAGYRIKLLEFEPISAAQRNSLISSSNGSNNASVARRRDDSDDEDDQSSMGMDANTENIGARPIAGGHLAKRAR
ncbi:hypothetical protein LPJ53_004516, partial [Coemansia erecta]